MPPLRVVAYSDFLCPWCWNAATRLASVEGALGAAIEVDWRSFLLRPRPDPSRRGPEALERFRLYTRSWLRVAEDEPRAPFQVWASDAGPPSHSVPPHLAAKAAAALDADAGRRMRGRLFRAYFAESRDISDPDALLSLWREIGLPDAEFGRCADPALLRRVLDEHREAQEHGATGVPALRLDGDDFVLMGAQPEAVTLRWLRRAIEARSAPA
ncbi:MAG TPA: DsbA family protein [Myxococcota bacterium]|nr:DsbA family protein [Myxococcota bacterium]